MNWLMLRGLAREQRHWGPFPKIFAERVPGARVHLLDLPGTGSEFRRASPGTVDGIMEDLRSRWQLLRAQHAGDWGLFAVSLGGMVAMQWCAQHPDDFRRLVIVNSSAGDLSPPWRRMELGVMPTVARTLFEKDPTARERAILGFTTRLVPDKEPIAQLHATFTDQPMSKATAVRQIVAAARFRAPPRIAVPTLVLASDGDRLCSPECPKRLARHFDAVLEVHPTAGHDLPLDDPGWVADKVRGWIGIAAAA